MANLEQEIAQIEQQLAQKRAALREQHEQGSIIEMPHEKETLREVVREHVGEPTATPAVPPTQTPSQPTSTPTDDVPSYQTPALQPQVQKFVTEAFNSSIEEATKNIRATNNPALIDAFHDAIVDHLYDDFVKRGKIEPLKS